MNNIDSSIPQDCNISPEKPQKPVINNSLVIGILIGIVITLSIIVAVQFFPKNNKTAPDSNLKTDILDIKNDSVSQDQDTYGQFGKITWLDQPQPVSAINVLAQTETNENNSDYTTFDFSNTKYYHVANFSNGAKLINVYFNNASPEGLLARFIQDKNQLYFLTNMFVGWDVNELNLYISNNILRSDLVISELVPPKTLNLNDKTLYLSVGHEDGSSNYNQYNSLNNLNFIQKTEVGDLYVSVKNIFNNIQPKDIGARKFFLKSKDGNYLSYQYKNTLDIYDDRIPNIVWNSGDTNNDQYTQSIVVTCGYDTIDSIPIIFNNSPLLNDKVLVGKTKSGTNVYQIKNKNNQFVSELYNLYKTTNESSPDGNPVDLDVFNNQPNHFIIQDFTGDWQIFINQRYAPLAECGKPVIYLYPEQDSQIQVQVSADITHSEPTYPSQGWLVTAKPSGELIYQNQSYPYLFWEGIGHGFYPDYRHRGTLVAQKDLIATLYHQLSQLGLNQQESADFMEFWQPKLPQTSYVRLTWLGTKDMDKLAPLTINPKPDTSIRIFLEFEGYDKPVKLIPQTLSAPKRNGFTLVEWGGLLLKPAQ